MYIHTHLLATVLQRERKGRKGGREAGKPIAVLNKKRGSGREGERSIGFSRSTLCSDY